MDTVLLSIIIVNYNGEQFLKDCITSINKCCKNISYEIIIVDNASSDNSFNVLKELNSEIKLIKSKENLGFAKGNNLGVAKSKGKFVLLLNNDTVLLSDITNSINILEENKDFGVLSIKMLDKNSNYAKSAGRFPTILNLLFFSKLFLNKNGFSDGNFSNKLLEVDWVQGSFLLLSRSLYLKVNGLDEDYFMYVEDVDFCKKIKKLDKKVVYQSNQSYLHFGGFNPSRKKLLIDGYLLYVKKHFTIFKPLALLVLKFKKSISI
ncbi:glycosyltransferase family 2 protein [uncultured Polaribacter sp.]|uniref:glycosyltransferase family 2 protein n=1 Tax=uncultured Polaribacter sp. TaxID=174711 RepID=UPI0026241624|nr:glycosyltransferase family 2 protein [uncultured Polaribacter sp.]